MSGVEVVAIISGLVNVIGALAGIFGWKKATKTRKVAEAVIRGVEAADVKAVKQAIAGVACKLGVSKDVDNLVQLVTKK